MINLGCGIRGEPQRSWNSIWFLRLKQTTKENQLDGGKLSPPQQEHSQGLYLTVVGTVGAAIQEHFQCTAKDGWDFNFLRRVQHERLTYLTSLKPPPKHTHPTAKQRDKHCLAKQWVTFKVSKASIFTSKATSIWNDAWNKQGYKVGESLIGPMINCWDERISLSSDVSFNNRCREQETL